MSAPSQDPTLFSMTFQISGRRVSAGIRYWIVSAHMLATVPMIPHTQDGILRQAIPRNTVSGMKATIFMTTSPDCVGLALMTPEAMGRRSIPTLDLNVSMACGFGISTAVAIAAA